MLISAMETSHNPWFGPRYSRLLTQSSSSDRSRQPGGAAEEGRGNFNPLTRGFIEKVGEEASSHGLMSDNEDILLFFQFHNYRFNPSHEVSIRLKHMRNLLMLLFYSGTRPSYLTDLLSLTLVGVIGSRINVRSSYTQRGPP